MEIKPVECVALIEDGRYSGGVFADEKSLLVSYDMMPLSGLGVYRQKLIDKGRIPHRCHVSPASGDEFDFWTCTFQGQLSLRMMDWGVHKPSEFDALTSVAFYLHPNEMQNKDEEFLRRYVNEYGLVEKEDRELFNSYHWFIAFDRHKDGRRRRTWERMQTEFAELCQKYGIQAVRVIVTPIEPIGNDWWDAAAQKIEAFTDECVRILANQYGANPEGVERKIFDNSALWSLLDGEPLVPQETVTHAIKWERYGDLGLSQKVEL